METQLYAIIAGAFIINLVITYIIIQDATGTKKKLWYMERQMKLLIRIAKLHGATQEEINEDFE